MAAFVLASATGIARGVVDQLVDAAFAVVAERAAAAAAAATAAAAAAASAEMAATNALRRAKRKEQQPATERALLPRGRRTFAEAEPCALAQRPVQRPAQEAAPGKGAKKLAPRRRFGPATVKALRRIACDRRLQRADVVGGEKMSRAEWAQLRGDAWELRKVYAVDAYLRLRAADLHRTSRNCYEEAARSVVAGLAQRQLNWQTVRKWGSTATPTTRGRRRWRPRGRRGGCECVCAVR